MSSSLGPNSAGGTDQPPSTSFIYESLYKNLKEIRVIVLEPAEDAILQFLLQIVSLLDKLVYGALSYCWTMIPGND